MSEKVLGKIDKARFGQGGYQGAMIGITFELKFNDCTYINDFWGYWSVDRSGRTEWTEEERCKSLGETSMRISKLLSDAQKHTVDQLAGTPIEIEFDGMKMLSWRVLTEVL